MLASEVENWAFLFHIVGVFALITGVTVAGLAFEAARRRSLASEIALLLSLCRVGAVLVAAGSVVLAPFGLWLVHIEHIGYGAGWVDAATALFIVVAGLGVAGGQIPRRARELAETLAPDAVATPELRALLDDRGARLLNAAAGVGIVVIVWLMVFKPGGPGS